MEYLKNLRHLKKIKDTRMARLIAALIILTAILIAEFAYIICSAVGNKAYAGEIDDDVIVICDDADDQEEDKSEDPVVKVKIDEPEGWHRKSAKVKFSAKDISGSEDFSIEEVRAKIGQSGSWTDVTDSLSLEVNENCVVYVEFTDTEGRTYSKNKRITCFDNGKPTLNAAVNNGSLTVETNDDESGVKAIYVNGFEFTDLTEGTLNIRMQQFDTGYENFSIQAIDYAGNMSETYRVRNPYYKAKDASGKDVKLLPDSAEATKPAEAAAEVIDHVKTDSEGNTLAKVSENSSGDSKSNEKKKALAEADRYETVSGQETVPGKGKEFYTIEAKSGKVFYLIIDRDGEDEKVHFVTDITENDLLNVTDERSETLPQNAAISDKDAAFTESALPNNNRLIDDFREDETELFEEPASEEPISADGLSADEKTDDHGNKKEANPLVKVIIILMAIGIVVAVHFLNKMVKKRDGDFIEEEDPEDDEAEDDDPGEDEGDVNDEFYE
ncbi:MAG: DUF4366 domain-containing protein [Lachnospiraceae bacterium]|nr:DUF4366 domain-containing protein [Lachnospiraceae bacterium]